MATNTSHVLRTLCGEFISVEESELQNGAITVVRTFGVPTMVLFSWFFDVRESCFNLYDHTFEYIL